MCPWKVDIWKVSERLSTERTFITIRYCFNYNTLEKAYRVDTFQRIVCLVLTFGTKSTAYLAVKCLQALNVSMPGMYPQVVAIIRRDFNVDLLTAYDIA